MKILVLSDDFPPNGQASAETVAFNLARDLQKRGHSLFVITTTRDKSGGGESEYERMRIFKVYSNYPVSLMSYFSLYNPQTIGRVREIIKKIKPDIVHAHNIHYHLSYHCLKISKKYTKAVFLTAHDTMLFSYGKFDNYINKTDLSVQKDFNYKASVWGLLKTARKRFNPFRNIIIRHYLKYVDKVLTNSEVLQKALEDNGIKNAATVHLATDIKPIFSREDADNFRAEYGLSDKKIILFGGRLSQLKGGEIAVKSLGYIVRQIPNAILLVAGDRNNFSKYMEELAGTLGVKESLIFTGWLSREEMNFAYAVCNVVITPSIYLDAFNLFNLEAMAAGRPIVGTCFGGTPEIILDGVTGYIVNPFNIEMLADKIIDFLKDPAKVKRFGEAGMKRAKEYFSLDLYTERTLEWYKKFYKF